MTINKRGNKEIKNVHNKIEKENMKKKNYC